MDNFSSNNLNLVFPTHSGNPGMYTITSKDTSGTILVPRVVVKGETGNVGIGTTGPTSLLHLASASSLDLNLFSTAAGGYSRLFFGTGTYGNRWNVGMRGDGTQAGGFSIEGDSTGLGSWGSRLFINLAGNVGIGTTNPSSPLTVSADIQRDDETYSSSLLEVGGPNAAYRSLAVFASPQSFPKSDGTTNNWSATGAPWASPMIYRSMRLPNNGSGSFPNNNYGELILQGVSHGASYNRGISFATWDGTNDPAIRMRVDPLGNVGIGTTQPAAKLDVSGDIRAYGHSLTGIINVRSFVTKANANSVCPSPSTAIHVPWAWMGKTGNELCAADARQKTTCSVVKYVFVTVANGWGTYPPADFSCANTIDLPWPWGNEYPTPDTLDGEWGHGDTWVVCCQ
jgi:hypothetical protein